MSDVFRVCAVTRASHSCEAKNTPDVKEAKRVMMPDHPLCGRRDRRQEVVRRERRVRKSYSMMRTCPERWCVCRNKRLDRCIYEGE